MRRIARRISVTLTEAEHAARRAETEAQLLTRAQPMMSASALELPDMVLSFMASPNLQPVSAATLTCSAGCSADAEQWDEGGRLLQVSSGSAPDLPRAIVAAVLRAAARGEGA